MTVQQRSYKVLVIGDACEDIYVYVDRLDRENPESLAPIVRNNRIEKKDGMALNVANCLTKLGFYVDYVIGDKVSTKLRVIDNNGEHLIRVDNDEQSTPLEDNDSGAVIWANYDAVVVSDYNKGSVSLNTLRLIADNFKGPKFLDTKKTDIEDLWPHFIVKINESESWKYKSPMAAGSVITMGADGAVKAGNTTTVYQPLLVPEVDVCGAGDAFLAGLVYGKFFGTILEDIEYGIVNAGISVTHIGTYAPTEKELEEAAEEYYDQTRRTR